MLYIERIILFLCITFFMRLFLHKYAITFLQLIPNLNIKIMLY